jgi:predicted acyltransferase
MKAGLMFDEEGLVSTLPALLTCFIGIIKINQPLGYTFFKIASENKDDYKRLSHWLLYSIVLLGLGVFLEQWIPFNKPLWTTSFALYTSGWAGIFLSFISFIVDLYEFNFPLNLFKYPGTNPLFMYIVPTFFQILLILIKINDVSLFSFLFRYLFLTWLNDYRSFAALLYALIYESIWLFFSFILFKRNIFIKL